MKQFRASTIAVMIVASLLILGIVSAASRERQPVGAASVLRAGTAAAQESSFERARTRTCSLGTMQGTHGYAYSGTVMGNNIAAAGPITFDGDGNLSATYNVSLGGKIFQGAFTGIYTVNADCTGTVTLHLPLLGISTSGSFVIVNSGKETFFTGTDTGITVTGATKKL